MKKFFIKKISILFLSVLSWSFVAQAEISKFVGFSSQASAAKIGFALGSDSKLTLENDFVSDNIGGIEKYGAKYD